MTWGAAGGRHYMTNGEDDSRDWWGDGLVALDPTAGQVLGKPLMLPTKRPGDRFPYPKHAASRPFSPDLEPGSYVYVQDAQGVVWVVPDGPHMHPQVLGGAQAAAGAGELTVEAHGVVTEVNNISGTFQCPPGTLPQVIEALRAQGAQVIEDAAVEFTWED